MTRVPERWDVGQWDTAHWDGQLGLDAAVGAIVLTGQPATLQVTQHITLTAAPGAIALNGSDAALIVTPAAAIDWVLTAAPGAIVLAGAAAGLQLTRAPFVMPPPGRLEFGQRVFIPGRW
jgi:hypothetical protein